MKQSLLLRRRGGIDKRGNNNSLLALRSSFKRDEAGKEEKILQRENEMLRREIRMLQRENRLLEGNSKQQRVVIEMFEGENEKDDKWFEEVDYGNRKSEKNQDNKELVLQKDDDETDEYWQHNASTIMNDDEEMEMFTDEECLIPSGNTNDWSCPTEPDVSFLSALGDRSLWLVGLLGLQSCSGFILARNEELIQRHPIIIYFLTMLVGAGGNAGNQASVRVIRGLALGTLNESTQRQFLSREVNMALSLSFILSLAGFFRAVIFRTPFPETVAITFALMSIVLISICLGAVLPLMLKKVGVDPAHSSTTIQVLMDIFGVLITVLVSSTILDSSFGKLVVSKLSW